MSVDLVVPTRAGDGAEIEVPDHLDALVRGWLIAHASGSDQTLRSYRTAIALWTRYLDERGIDVLSVTKTDFDAWHRILARIPSPRTGRPLSKATLAQRTAAVSSFYTYLVDEDVLPAVPIRRRTRPKTPRDSHTIGMSAREAAAFHRRLDLQVTQAEQVARVDPTQAQLVVEALAERAALLTLLMQGLRISELLSLPVGALRYDQGEPTMLVHGKGGKERTIAVAAPAWAAVDELLTARYGQDRSADAPVFPLGTGDQGRQRVARMIRRVARAAGVPSHARLSPHGLRHTCATLMLQRGVHSNVVQDFLGHASADTTARYDRARGVIERSALAVRALTNLLSEQVIPT